MIKAYSIPINLEDIEITEEMKHEFIRRGSEKYRTTTKLLLVKDLLPPNDVAHLDPFTPVLVIADYKNGRLDIEILEES